MMNGRKTFWTSIILGALAGGLLSLTNKNARQYGKHLAQSTNEKVKSYVQDPEQSIQRLKDSVHFANDFVNKNTSGAMNALEQVENTIRRFID